MNCTNCIMPINAQIIAFTIVLLLHVLSYYHYMYFFTYHGSIIASIIAPIIAFIIALLLHYHCTAISLLLHALLHILLHQLLQVSLHLSLLLLLHCYCIYHVQIIVFIIAPVMRLLFAVTLFHQKHDLNKLLRTILLIHCFEGLNIYNGLFILKLKRLCQLHCAKVRLLNMVKAVKVIF